MYQAKERSPTSKQVRDAGTQSHHKLYPQSCDPQLGGNSKLKALKTNGAHIHETQKALTI